MIEVEEPDFAPWDGRRVPVTLLGGYLGSGKTTLLNEMLRRTEVPIAVFVNDVGAVNIDSRLIEQRAADTLELTGGCVCCSLKNGFLEAFEQLRNREDPPELVVVELSGVADPGPVAGLASTAGFAVDGIVVLVDLDRFRDLESEESVIADSIRAQLDAADVVLLTKRDLVDADEEAAVRARLAELQPDLPIRTADSIDSAAGLVGLAVRRGPEQPEPRPTLFDQFRVDQIPVAPGVTRSEVDELVGGLPDDVLRAKGIIRLDTGDDLLVQVVGRRRSIEPLPMAESQPPADLVVISVR